MVFFGLYMYQNFIILDYTIGITNVTGKELLTESIGHFVNNLHMTTEEIRAGS